jgi:hypothetical protein
MTMTGMHLTEQIDCFFGLLFERNLSAHPLFFRSIWCGLRNHGRNLDELKLREPAIMIPN